MNMEPTIIVKHPVSKGQYYFCDGTSITVLIGTINICHITLGWMEYTFILFSMLLVSLVLREIYRVQRNEMIYFWRRKKKTKNSFRAGGRDHLQAEEEIASVATKHSERRLLWTSAPESSLSAFLIFMVGKFWSIKRKLWVLFTPCLMLFLSSLDC